MVKRWQYIIINRCLLLENLLTSCKSLTINTRQAYTNTRETNLKQIFRKHQKENICLTCLTTAMNGNSFSVIWFCAAK